MADKQTLLDLADRVEADAGKFTPSYNSVLAALKPYGAWDMNIDAALDGSLDAAKALHDAVLPGWEFTIYSHIQAHHPPEQVYVQLEGKGYYSGKGSYLAAAWVAAILRAVAESDRVERKADECI